MAKIFGMLAAAAAVSAGLIGCGGGAKCDVEAKKKHTEETKEKGDKVGACKPTEGEPMAQCDCQVPLWKDLVKIDDEFISGDCKEAKFLDEIKKIKAGRETSIGDCDSQGKCIKEHTEKTKAKSDDLGKCAPDETKPMAKCDCQVPLWNDLVKIDDELIAGSCKETKALEDIKKIKAGRQTSLGECESRKKCIDEHTQKTKAKSDELAACKPVDGDPLGECKCQVPLWNDLVKIDDELIAGSCKDTTFLDDIIKIDDELIAGSCKDTTFLDDIIKIKAARETSVGACAMKETCLTEFPALDTKLKAHQDDADACAVTHKDKPEELKKCNCDVATKALADIETFKGVCTKEEVVKDIEKGWTDVKTANCAPEEGELMAVV